MESSPPWSDDSRIQGSKDPRMPTHYADNIGTLWTNQGQLIKICCTLAPQVLTLSQKDNNKRVQTLTCVSRTTLKSLLTLVRRRSLTLSEILWGIKLSAADLLRLDNRGWLLQQKARPSTAAVLRPEQGSGFLIWKRDF